MQQQNKHKTSFMTGISRLNFAFSKTVQHLLHLLRPNGNVVFRYLCQ